MSFLKNLFGGTFETHFDAGEALFEEGRLGEAKLCYEKALGRRKDAPEGSVKRAEQQIAICSQQLAETKLAEADETARGGDLEGALLLLQDAREISQDPKILEAIQERVRSYEAEDTRRLVEDSEELSEEELMTIIAGTWTDAQAEEYAAMPEDLEAAFLAAHDGEHEKAVEVIKGILARDDLTETPKYLYLELGRAQVMCEQFQDAVEMLDTFLKAVDGDKDATEVKVQACDIKAVALAAMERFDEAEEQLRVATAITPEDHRVFLKLGVFLRGRERFSKAVGALEKARELMGQMQPDFTVIRELGFTYLAMERKEEAKACLTSVIEHLASRGEHNQFDPQTTVALASLREETGEPMLAADLYRHLAVGYDTRNHFVYNAEAARLLKAAGADEALVDRYVTRAMELVSSDEQRDVLNKILSR